MKITIGGDFCITDDFLSRNLFDESIIDVFNNSDYNIVNLECPIVAERHDQIIKTGPPLKTSKKIVKHLSRLNINCVALANNHILDYGKAGLADTINFCIENNIKFVGANTNSLQIAEPLIQLIGNISFALINVCENEWSTVFRAEYGANPLDNIDIYSQIKNIKSSVDFVILIIHGGNEYNLLPSPRIVKQYRFFADIGADAIIGHHTHCISGYEIYKGTPIIYSLGNMIFTLHSKNKDWYYGLLVQMNLEKGKPIDIDLLPISQDKTTFKLKQIRGEEKEEIISEINILSEIIKDKDKLKIKWNEFINDKKNLINIMSPLNAIPVPYLSSLFNKVGLSRLLLTQKYLKNLLNYIRCESHKDLIIELLKKEIYKK